LANKYKEVYDEPNPHVDWWLEQKGDKRS
jgi:hypothetical protein